MMQTRPAHTDDNVRLLFVSLIEHWAIDDRPDRSTQGWEVNRGRLPGTQQASHITSDSLGLHVTDDRQDEVVGKGIASIPANQIVSAQPAHGLRGPYNVESIGVTWEEALGTECKSHLEEIVFVMFDGG